MMRRYASTSFNFSGEDNPTWFAPDEDTSRESTLAMTQGFLAIAKGFFDGTGPSCQKASLGRDQGSAGSEAVVVSSPGKSATKEGLLYVYHASSLVVVGAPRATT